MQRTTPATLGNLEGTAPRIWAEFSSQALLNNFRAIHRQVPGCRVLPMVKADAYGHGMEWVAKVIAGDSALHESLAGFGVATLDEGVRLRAVLGSSARNFPILICSGAAPWSEDIGQICERHALCPTLATLEDWDRFRQSGWASRLTYEVKFNTGMNRLGLPMDALQKFKRDLQEMPQHAHPTGVLSHLAVAEDPRHPVSRKQIAAFEHLLRELQAILPNSRFHLGNSSAIWNHRHFKLKQTDLVRPGISLYGIPPWPGSPARGLKPVMNLQARIIALHHLRPGDSIGYGATFRVAKKSRALRAAILACGYGDGIHRALSNRGYVRIGSSRAAILGIVSMDLLAVRAPAKAAIGQVARILGEGVDPWEQAQAANSIPYELFTSLSARVQRNYD